MDYKNQEGKVFFVRNGTLEELEMPKTGFGSGELKWVDGRIVYAATTSTRTFPKNKK